MTWMEALSRATKAAAVAVVGLGGALPAAKADTTLPPAPITRTEPLPLAFRDGPPSLVGSVRLVGDGKMVLDTGIVPYTRSYAQSIKGPLRFAHGSVAPSTSVAGAHDILQSSPGKSLDAMARALGINDVAFEAMAHSKDFHDPARPAWWGLCAQWSWTSLSSEINKRVDVEGPAGQRGLWLAGQWMSRADLGNWAMATSLNMVHLAGQHWSAQGVGEPKPLDLLKSMQLLQAGGPGVIIDVHNDKASGTKETWNQPMVRADVESASVPADVEQAIIERAKAKGFHGSAVELVTITGHYGLEVTDQHEDAPGMGEKTWRMYVLTASDGDARWAYSVDDELVKDLGAHRTDPLPDYIVTSPHDLIQSALAGDDVAPFSNQKYGREFFFYVGTVLKHGVPGPVRAAFEKDVAANVDANELATRYPNVANAFTPEQWRASFPSLDAKTFGAIW